ncbi:MAG: leucine-rich repeat domain-containing protein [Oscillospiraceae bacterium]|nr:leucine-rich repeat domain-containing protein [Oscillospiraceae bacterium]
MAIVNAKCTNCGAELQVDSDRDAMICEYCGSAFVVEKAIRNVSVTNHIQAGNVTIMSGTLDFEVRAGVLTKYNGPSPDVVIPDRVTVIGEGAFEFSAGITSVRIPEGVTSIGQRAFAHCPQLRKVVFPESLREIDNFAFNECAALESVEFPQHLERIGDYAFFGCTGLSEVTIPDSVERIGNRAFADCDGLMQVHLPPVIQLSMDAFPRRVLPEDQQMETPQKDTNACYIATCVYGSYDCPEVWTLRRFRDNTLAESACGRAFIRCYYAVSPHLVKHFGETKLFRRFWRGALDRMVGRLRKKGVSDTPYSDQ